jgi:hypothetical protein
VPTQQGVFFPDVTLHGDDWAFGLTAGVTITPTPTTTIGIGYRSALNQKIDGSLVLTSVLAPFSNGSVHTTVDLPDVVSLGVRQRLTPQLTLLGTAEWSNWSRIGTSNILQASGAPALINGNPVKIPFEYRDGWFFSGGAEYQWSDRLTLRSGVAYEISPVTDQVRIPLVPDNNRVWASRRELAGLERLLFRSGLFAHLGEGSFDQRFVSIRQSTIYRSHICRRQQGTCRHIFARARFSLGRT